MPLLNDQLDFSDHPLYHSPLYNCLQSTFPSSGYSIVRRFLRMRPFAAVILVIWMVMPWPFSAMSPLPMWFVV